MTGNWSQKWPGVIFTPKHLTLSLLHRYFISLKPSQPFPVNITTSSKNFQQYLINSIMQDSKVVTPSVQLLIPTVFFSHCPILMSRQASCSCLKNGKKKIGSHLSSTNLGKSYLSGGKMTLLLHKDSKIKVCISSISQSKTNKGRDMKYTEGSSFKHYLFVININ